MLSQIKVRVTNKTSGERIARLSEDCVNMSFDDSGNIVIDAKDNSIIDLFVNYQDVNKQDVYYNDVLLGLKTKKVYVVTRLLDSVVFVSTDFNLLTIQEMIDSFQLGKIDACTETFSPWYVNEFDGFQIIGNIYQHGNNQKIREINFNHA